jgi:MFS family permease
MAPPAKPALAERLGLPRPSPITGIFLTVFLDLLSFGMFIPDLQLRGRDLAAKSLGLNLVQALTDHTVALMVSGILGAFSLAQLISSPVLGRMSDRIGRRKVLLITIGLSVASYFIYAFADQFSVVVFARVLAGVAAANLGVAFAYVADVTTLETRAQGLGKIGAALGLGFILGPVAGGLLLKFGNNSPLLLGVVGGSLALLNFIYVWLLMSESLPESKQDRASFGAELRVAFTTPGLALLLAMFFAYNFAFANLQSTFFLLLADPRSVFHLGETDAKTYGSYLLGSVGLTSAIVQGFLVPRLVKRFGEIKVLRVALIIMVPALTLVPFGPLWVPALLITVALALGSGLSQPAITSLISRSAPPQIQGGIFGINQSIGALARLVGPVVAPVLFAMDPTFPYLLGGVSVLVTAVAAWSLRETPKPAPSPA